MYLYIKAVYALIGIEQYELKAGLIVLHKQAITRSLYYTHPSPVKERENKKKRRIFKYWNRMNILFKLLNQRNSVTREKYIQRESSVEKVNQIKLGWRGGSVGRASDSRSKDPKFEPRQVHKKKL